MVLELHPGEYVAASFLNPNRFIGWGFLLISASDFQLRSMYQFEVVLNHSAILRDLFVQVNIVIDLRLAKLCVTSLFSKRPESWSMLKRSMDQCR